MFLTDTPTPIPMITLPLPLTEVVNTKLVLVRSLHTETIYVRICAPIPMICQKCVPVTLGKHGANFLSQTFLHISWQQSWLAFSKCKSAHTLLNATQMFMEFKIRWLSEPRLDNLARGRNPISCLPVDRLLGLQMTKLLRPYMLEMYIWRTFMICYIADRHDFNMPANVVCCTSSHICLVCNSYRFLHKYTASIWYVLCVPYSICILM